MSIATSPSASHAAVVAEVAAALAAAMNQLPIGGTLAFSRLAAIAYAADPAVINVTAVTLNGATLDLVPPVTGMIRPGTITVS
jgi:hypothetical protein